MHLYPHQKLIHYNYTLSRLRKQHFFTLLSGPQKLAHTQTVVDTYNAVCALIECDNSERLVPKKNQNQFSTKFAALKLTAEDKAAFEKWKKEHHDDGDVLYANQVRVGWKGSQTYDQENDCFVWSMTQRDEDDINYDVCVTSRSDNMYEAMLIGLFKLLVMVDGKRIPTERAKDNWG